MRKQQFLTSNRHIYFTVRQPKTHALFSPISNLHFSLCKYMLLHSSAYAIEIVKTNFTFHFHIVIHSLIHILIYIIRFIVSIKMKHTKSNRLLLHLHFQSIEYIIALVPVSVLNSKPVGFHSRSRSNDKEGENRR